MLKDDERAMLRDESNEPMLWKSTHHLYREHAAGEDSQAHGLKAGFTTFAGNWYICTALSMTIGFALIVIDPPGIVRAVDGHSMQHASATTFVARSAYVALVLGGIMCSTVGAIICAYTMDDVSGIPAAAFADYLAAAARPENRMTSTYAYPMLGLKLNLYALLPLCYLQHGAVGFGLAVGMCLLFLGIVFSENRKRNNLRRAFNERLSIGNSWNEATCNCSPWGIPFALGTVFDAWDEESAKN